jgi:hypothetical protein
MLAVELVAPGTRPPVLLAVGAVEMAVVPQVIPNGSSPGQCPAMGGLRAVKPGHVVAVAGDGEPEALAAGSAQLGPEHVQLLNGVTEPTGTALGDASLVQVEA